jgi:GNAT superfamily N-acetyltransferase
MGITVYMRRMRITRAQERDIGDMARMIGGLFALEKDFTADEAKQRRGLEALLASQQAAAFLAVDEISGETFGMVTVQLTISTAEGGPSGLLEDLFVEEGRRRKGAASALVAAAEAWCLERGARRVQLLADKDNARALAFYDKALYRETRMVARRRMLDSAAPAAPSASGDHFSS